MKFIKKIIAKNSNQIKKELLEFKVLHVTPERVENFESFYIDVANQIGTIFCSEEDFITKNKTGNLWSEIKYIEEKSESFSHSNTRQPFHTDGAYELNAPDISFFYCVERANFGGATTFIDSDVLIKCLSFCNGDLLKKIKNTIVYHYKGDDGKKALILDDKNWNWNYFRAEKSNLVEEFHNFLEEKIYKSGIYESVYLNPGDSLFFWDKKVLHGRNGFIGNRHLKKAGIYV